MTRPAAARQARQAGPARPARPDRRVRLEAVRGLVSLNETALVAGAGGDPSREVRIAVAAGLGATALGAAALGAAGSGASRPGAAGMGAAGMGAAGMGAAGMGAAGMESAQRGSRDPQRPGSRSIGGDPALPALGRLAADEDPLVRAAALRAAGQAGCPPPLAALAVTALGAPAAGPLTTAAADQHADVRKAAVIGLAAWASHPAAQAALRSALGDSDADVRAHARRALAAGARAVRQRNQPASRR